ncbi:Uncharacterised protein [Mycobacteroides abscessus subsp. abscessus]|nr:Uncharacterised protein [Mycobacteroides abscessus subsp. abscessus]
MAADLFECDDHLDGACSGATVLLVDEQAEDADVGELAEDTCRGRVITLGPCTGNGGCVGLREERVDARCEVVVDVGQQEVHRSPIPAREAEEALRDHIALNLVGACVDRPGQREEVAVNPCVVDLGVGAL